MSRGDNWLSTDFMRQPWNRGSNTDTTIIVDTQVTEVQAIHDSMLYDTCVPQTRTNSSNGYTRPTFANGTALSCVILDVTPTQLGQNEQNQTQARMTVVEIRFNRSVTFNNLARIKVTKLHGVAVTGNMTYEIVEGPQLDHTGVMVTGQLVTDGTH